MAGHVYKIIDLVGTSEVGITEAVEAAVNRASETIKGLDWFEVKDVRGQIEDGRIAWYQAHVQIGFRVMTPDELAAN